MEKFNEIGQNKRNVYVQNSSQGMSMFGWARNGDIPIDPS